MPIHSIASTCNAVFGKVSTSYEVFRAIDETALQSTLFSLDAMAFPATKFKVGVQCPAHVTQLTLSLWLSEL